MNDNQESVDKSDKNKGTPQLNETGNEDPAATPIEEETDYYEEGDGGATD